VTATVWPYPSYTDRRWLGGERGPDKALAAVVSAVRRTAAADDGDALPDGAGQPDGDAAVLAGLRHLAEIAERVDWALLSLVGEARANGASWATVGEALGVSRQAAQQRFGPWVEEAMNQPQ
jgi:hypothetical protein